MRVPKVLMEQNLKIFLIFARQQIFKLLVHCLISRENDKIKKMPDIYIAPSKNKKVSHKKRIIKEAIKIIEKIGEEKTKNPLAAFVALPAKVKFETQDKEEKIILLLRRHWVTNVPWILLVLLMLVVPLGTRFFPLFNFIPQRFFFIFIAMWYLFTLAFFFEKFLAWFFNLYFITDERIIDVDFVSLIYREISEAKIENIQDVSYRTGGLLKSIFDYGDLYIQTAGEVPRIEFEAVPKPDKVVKVLDQLIVQEEQEKIEGRVR